MAKLPYSVIINREPDGRYIAWIPKLPEATCYGTSVETAFIAAGEAIDRAIAARVESGEAIPPPDFT
jgi:predicted RNase H-like HicB family nuclease